MSNDDTAELGRLQYVDRRRSQRKRLPAEMGILLVFVKGLIKRLTRKLGFEINRYDPEHWLGCVSLPPRAPHRGNVLIAYILDPFLRGAGKPISTSHTHDWESVLMAEVWRDLGFRVDVIDYRNYEFVPSRRYDYFVSARTHLELLASRLDPECIKIAHLDTSHYVFNNHATYSRLLAMQNRRGMTLPQSARLVEHNRAIDVADYGVVLGNDQVAESYFYAGKPMFTLPVPAAIDTPWDDTKDFSACRNNFLWLGSSGLVHKGLDLVLEAFAGMPEAHLTVCGPVESEPPFRELYRRELFQTANISYVGWVDIAGEEFRRIVRNTVGVVYPSCAEAQAGSIINCLRAGLIPIVTPETTVPVGEFGILLDQPSVDSIQAAVRQLAALPTADLSVRSRRAWNHASTYHSHDAYRRQYTTILENIFSDNITRPTVN